MSAAQPDIERNRRAEFPAPENHWHIVAKGDVGGILDKIAKRHGDLLAGKPAAGAEVMAEAESGVGAFGAVDIEASGIGEAALAV
jgi:tripartite-type tricarboxylate transporter receptor subunit TctC